MGSKDSVIVRVAGAAGDGIASTGEVFGKILEYIRAHPNKAILKQTKELLTLKISDIKGLGEALRLLEEMG